MNGNSILFYMGLGMEREYFAQLLREKGLKVTNQRIEVLEALSKGEDAHLTAEEIYDDVRVRCPDIGLATVYRTIQLFLKLQLVDRITMNEGRARYGMGAMDEKTKHHHHHLICLSCGKVMSFSGDLLDTLEEYVYETKGFQVMDHEVKFYGYCQECRQRMRME